MGKIIKVGEGLREFPIGLLNDKITEINVSYNEIEEFPEEITLFSGITSITFSNNKIRKLPETIYNLKNLSHLHLSGNPIDIFPKSLKELFALFSIILDNCNYYKFPDITSFPNTLIFISLSENNIRQIPKNILNLKELGHLYLKGNQISKIPKELCELKELKILDLRNNNLSYLPEEIRNLTNLETLYLEGNPNLPLPSNLNPKEPKVLINYILRKQKLPQDTIKISKVYIYQNTQSDEIKESLKEVYEDTFKENLKYELIEGLSQVKKSINVLFFILPYDVHKNEGFLEKLIRKCDKLNLKYHFFLPEKGTVRDTEMNFSKIEKAVKVRVDIEKSYNDKIIYYKSKEDLGENMLGLMKEHQPKVCIQSLELQNIGHFENLSINFDDSLTCLVGENGTGKTTIIRALALALIGHEHEQLNINRIKQMLRIHGLENNSELKEEGQISLRYTIDDEEVYNIFTFTPTEDGRDIKLHFETTNPFVYGHNYLKSLVLGFPQVHQEIDLSKQQQLPDPLQQPHIEDLIPLINNVDENRLLSFMGWLANLNNEASNGHNDHVKSRAKQIIQKTFEIVSKIIDNEISFHRVKTVTPLDIWIKTPDAPNGIPLHLVSQGFKEVIGWIGHLLQRLAEAHPISKDFTKENGVVILDEIDAFTHPKWQVRLLDVMKETFVNIQFIVSTHSPLAILNQDINEVKELHLDAKTNTVTIQEHEDENAKIDLATTVLNYFDISTLLKKDWQTKVDRFYELKLAGENNNELKELQKSLDKTLIGLPIHDYRYFLFLKFLKDNGIDPNHTVEKIEMTDEELAAYKEAYAEYL